MMRMLFVFTFLVSCASASQSSIEQIDAEKVVQLVEKGVTIVDIRTPAEYQSGHIPGVIHIDFLNKVFLDSMQSLNKGEPVIIHCASGGRSAKAAKMLQEAGFDKIYDYSGGFKDWSSRGLKIEK
ncbi:rhodanese-like domain-containing protein [Ekhidna sp.]|uniref:rhodanese-like domain-containing protein n=1 Tax=Ekhidna sp. TaxID=2608089 RepID=UPI003CCC42E1